MPSGRLQPLALAHFLEGGVVERIYHVAIFLGLLLCLIILTLALHVTGALALLTFRSFALVFTNLRASALLTFSSTTIVFAPSAHVDRRDRKEDDSNESAQLMEHGCCLKNGFLNNGFLTPR